MYLFALTLLFVSVYCAVLPENKPQSSSEFALPDIEKICANDVNVDQCIRQAVSDVVGRLYSQLPPLRVSLVDPLVADGLRQAANSNSPTKIYSNSHVTEVNIYFPKIVVEGTYQADMKYQGSSKTTSGPFNVAMSRPEPSQMPVVHSVLGDTLASTGDFVLNLTPNILQNRPELNNAQRPEDSSKPTFQSRPVVTEGPQVPNLHFVGNKPKSKIVVGTSKDQANGQFDLSQAEIKPPIKPSTGGNFGSTQLSEQQKPNIQSVTESKPEILLIKPSSTQDSTLRPAIETKPTILEVLNPTPVIKNVPTLLVESNSDSQKLPENQPNLEALPEPIVPPVLMRPSSTEESTKRPATDNLPALDVLPGTFEIPVVPPILSRPPSTEESSTIGPVVKIKPALEDVKPDLNSDSPTVSQDVGDANLQPQFVDISPASPEPDTAEQPITLFTPPSDAIVESDTQLNKKPGENTALTSDSDPSLTMIIPEDNPSVTQTSDSSPPKDDMTIPSVDFVLPSFVQSCDENDPDFGRCLREAIWAVIPSLYNEYQPFQIRRLDPLNIERTHIDYDSGYFQVAANFEDLVTKGLSEALYRDIRLKITDDIVRADVSLFLPKISLEARYDAVFENNGFMIPASGPFNVTMTDIDMTQKWTGRFVTKNQHKYLNVDRIEMIPAVGSVNLILENGVAGQPRNDIAVNFLNQNWADMYKELVQSTRSSWEPIMVVAVNEFLGRIPFDLLIKPKAQPTTGSTTMSSVESSPIIVETTTEPALIVIPNKPFEGSVIPMETSSSVDTSDIPNEVQTSSDFPSGSDPADEAKLPTPILENIPETNETPVQPIIMDKPESSIIATMLQVPSVEEFIKLGDKKPCKKNNPSFDQCIQEYVSAIIPGLFTAIKPFQSAQIDPLNVPTAKIEYNNDILKSVISVENLATHGWSQAEYRDAQFKIDGDNVRVDFKIFLPQLSLDGIYNADIQFTYLELHPIVTGPFNVTMYDVEMTQNWKGHFVMKNGHSYVEIDEIEMSPEVGRVDFHEAGDFPDEGTKEIAIVFLNGNWGGMYKLLVPATRAVWEPPMKNALNQFLSGLPFDLLITSEDQQATVNDSELQTPLSTGESLAPPAVADTVTTLQEPSTSSELPMPPLQPTPAENKPKDEASIVAAPAPPTEKPMSTGEFILPDSIQPCNETDVDFDACVRDTVWRIVQVYFAENNPFRDVQLNPLYTETAEIIFEPGDTKKAITFENSSTYGFNDTQLQDMRMRVYSEGVQTEVSLFLPRLFIEGRYKAAIEYNGLKLNPTGPFNVSMENVQVVQNWRGHFVNRNQQKYLQIDEIKMTPEVGAANARVEGVFNDQRALVVESYLNRNWDRMYALLVAASSSSWEPIMISAVNAFLDRLPLDFIRLQNDNIGESLSPPAIVDPVITLQEPSSASESPIAPPQPTPTESPPKEELPMVAPSAPPTEKPMSTGEFVLPDSIQPCNEIDVNFDACVRDTVWRTVQVYFTDNNPFRAAQLNPLYTETTEIIFEPGDTKKTITFENSSTYGFNNTQLQDMRMRVYSEGVQTEVSLFLPRLFIEGRYKAAIEYNGLKLNPTGPFNVSMENVQVVQNWRGHFVNRNQHKYLQVDEIKMTPMVGAANARVEGVFNDQRALVVESYLNRNWDRMYALLVAASSSTWEPIMISAINAFLDRLPLDFIKLQNDNIDESLSPPAIVDPVINLQEPSTSSESPIAPPQPTPADSKPQEETATVAPSTPPTGKPMSTGEFVLPGEIKPCKENDPSFDQCIQESVSAIIPRLFTAIKPFQSAQIDPLNVPTAKIEYNNDILKSVISVENLATHGLSQAEYRDAQFKIDGDNVRVVFKIFLPQLGLDGIYNADIQFTYLELHPIVIGPFNVTMYDVEMTQNWKGHFVMKNGHRYVEIDEIEMSPEVGRVDFHEAGDFPDEGTKEIAIVFLNGNWGGMYKLLVPATRAVWEPPMKNALNQFLSGLPFDLLITSEDQQATANDSELQAPLSTGESLAPPAIADTVTTLQEPSTSSELPMRPPQPMPTGEFILPDSIQPCNETDVDFDACVRDTVWRIVQIYFTDNNPFRAAQLNPLYTETTEIIFEPGDTKKTITFENSSTYGFNDTQLQDMRMRVYSEGVQTEVSLFLPRLFIEGRYKAAIEYNGLKLNPTGPFNVSMEDVQVVQNWRGHFVNRNQHKYLQVDEIKMIPEVGAANARVEGVFNDQRALVVESYLNRNWDRMYALLVTASSSSWEPIMISAINAFLDRLPLDFIKLQNDNIGESLSPPAIVDPVISLQEPIITSESPIAPPQPAPAENPPKEELPMVAPSAPPAEKPMSTGEFVLPDSIQPCNESDVNFDACVRDTVWSTVQLYFTENNPFRAVQLNPLYTETAEILFEPGDTKKTITFENSSTYGFNDTQLQDMRMRVYSEGVQTEVSLFFPRLFIEGRYKAAIEYNGLKLNPTGPFNVSMENVQVVQNWRGHFVNRNQHKYLQVDEIKMTPVVGAANARVEGVFNDQRALVVESYLNRNWDRMYALLVAASSSSWEPIMISAVNAFLDRLPLDFIRLQNDNIGESLSPPAIVDPVITLQEPSSSSESPIAPPQPTPTESPPKEELPMVAPSAPPTEKPMSTGEFVLPDSIQPCIETDVNFDACVRDTVWSTVQLYFTENNPFRAVQLNPLYTETAEIIFEPGDTKKTITFENSSTYGFNDTQLQDMRMRVYSEGVQTEVSLFLPRLFIEGRYKAAIEYNGLKLNPTGPFNVSMENVQVVQNWRGHFVNRNQHKYLQIDEIKMTPEVGAANARVEGVFNDQRALVVESYLNRNWDRMYALLVTASSSSWEPIMISAVNAFLDRLPLDFIKLQNDNIGESLSPPAIVDPVISLQEPSSSSESPIAPPQPTPAESPPKEELPMVAPSAPPTEKPMSTGEFVLPDSIQPCNEIDVNFDACVRDTVWRTVQVYFTDNNPFRAAQLNPLYTETTEIIFEPGDTKKTITFENSSTYGFNNTQLQDMRMRVYSEGVQTEVSLFLPRLFIEGRYKAAIEYNGLKLNPTGPFNVSMENVQVVQNWRGHFVNRNQHKYLQVDEIKMTPMVGAANARVEGVFNDQRALVVESYLNRNWDRMYALLVAASSSTWEPIMISAINAFLDRLPLDFIKLQNDNIDESLSPPAIVDPVINLQEPSTSSESPIAPPQPTPADSKPQEETATVAPSTPPTGKPMSTGEFVLPGEIKPCKENDPSFDQCIQESVSAIIPRLFTAIKPFQSAQIDPLNVPTAKIEYNNDILKSVISVENLATHGLSQAEYRDAQFKIDGDNVRVVFKIFLPQLGLDGIYNADIQFTYLELHPIVIGPFNVTMYDVEMTQNWKGHFVMKNGHRYVEIDEIEMSPEVGRVDFHEAGDFPDEGTKEIAIVFLNGNWGGMYKLLVPATRAVWEPPMKNALNQFLSGLPFDLLITSEDQQATANDSELQAPLSTGESLAPPAIADTVTTLQEPSTSSELPMRPPQPMPTGEFILPDSIQPCNETDVDFDACVRDTVWRIVQIYFTDNNPFRAAQLNPLYTETTEIIFEPGDTKKTITFENSSTYGFNDTQLQDMRMRVYSEGVQTEVSLFLPRLFIEGRYKAAIEYNGLKLNPTGPFNVSMEDVQVVQNWRGHFVNRNQHKYLQVDEIKMIPEVGAANARVEGVFNDQRALVVESYLNRNWDRMYALLVTASSSSWEPIMISAINAFLDRLPLDFIKLQNDNIGESLSPPAIVDPVISLQEPIITSESPIAPPQPAPAENPPKEELPMVAPSAPPAEKPMSTGEFVLPDSIQPCNESDVNFDACVRDTVWSTVQLYFTENNPFRAVQLNPLYTETAEILFEPGDTKKTITFENSSTYGFNDTQLQDMRMRVYSEGVQTEVSLFFPRLFIEGRYKAAIEYNGLKLNPTGPFNVSMENVQVVQNWRGHFVNRNQHKYLQVDEIKMTPVVGAANARVEGVFNDQRALVVESYLNRNWDRMYALLVTASSSSWEPVMISAINAFLDRLPMDFINLQNENQ